MSSYDLGAQTMQAIIDNTNVWNDLLGVVEKRLNKNIFDSWFLPIKFEGCDESAHTLKLRTAKITKEWICSYYSELIQQSMTELNLSNYRIDWQIEEGETNSRAFGEEEEEIILETKTEVAAAAAAGSAETVNQQSFIKNNSTNFVDIEPIENSLNPKYTFEKFVVGSCNQ